MTFKTLSFQNADGETLSGRLDLPLTAVLGRTDRMNVYFQFAR